MKSPFRVLLNARRAYTVPMMNVAKFLLNRRAYPWGEIGSLERVGDRSTRQIQLNAIARFHARIELN